MDGDCDEGGGGGGWVGCKFKSLCLFVCEVFFKLFLELVIKKKGMFCIGVRHAVSFSI